MRQKYPSLCIGEATHALKNRYLLLVGSLESLLLRKWYGEVSIIDFMGVSEGSSPRIGKKE